MPTITLALANIHMSVDIYVRMQPSTAQRHPKTLTLLMGIDMQSARQQVSALTLDGQDEHCTLITQRKVIMRYLAEVSHIHR